jgi:hypothetical protein
MISFDFILRKEILPAGTHRFEQRAQVFLKRRDAETQRKNLCTSASRRFIPNS